MTAGVAIHAAAACGPETTGADANVVGFAYVIDSTIVQDEWVEYTGESSLPWRGQTRNERHYTEFTGCREVDNSVQPEDVYDDVSADEGVYELDYGYGALSWPYDESDDYECRDNFWCSSDDYSHCEAVHEDRYDYEILETRTIRNCPAPLVITMDKPEQPAIDTSCIEDISELQRIEQKTHRIISVTVSNPFYDEEDNPREMLQAKLDVSPEAWQGLEYGSNVSVIVADNQTVQLK